MKDFLTSLLPIARTVFSNYLELVKKNMASIIFLSVIGGVCFLLMVSDPKSEIAASSIKLTEVVVSSGKLMKSFFLVTCFFSSCAALVKFLEPQSSLIKLSANVAAEGMSSFIIPLAAYSFVIAVLIFIAHFKLSPAILKQLDLSIDTGCNLLKVAFFGLFFIPLALVGFKEYIISEKDKFETFFILLVMVCMMVWSFFEMIS